MGTPTSARPAPPSPSPLSRSVLSPPASNPAARTEVRSARQLVTTNHSLTSATNNCFSEQQPVPQTICAQGQGATTSACQQVPQPVCYGQVGQTVQSLDSKLQILEEAPSFPRTSRAQSVPASSVAHKLLSKFAARCLAGFPSGGEQQYYRNTFNSYFLPQERHRSKRYMEGGVQNSQPDTASSPKDDLREAKCDKKPSNLQQGLQGGDVQLHNAQI